MSLPFAWSTSNFCIIECLSIMNNQTLTMTDNLIINSLYQIKKLLNVSHKFDQLRKMENNIFDQTRLLCISSYFELSNQQKMIDDENMFIILIKLQMKALIKPHSKELFKRFERPPEDLQAIMNNIEARKIGIAVGIDVQQSAKFSWFFELIIKLKLPEHYKRMLNADKDDVTYYNQVTHQEKSEHPSLSIIKIFFYQTIENSKTVYSFTDKQGKLLPFVEQKMLRQCIGLSSKRRDAQKVNLQRDENGRMVMSKLQRINPDIKNLLATRSYMLKMLVEKVFTKRQIIGKGKRANAFTNTIAEYKQLMKQAQPDKDDQQQITQQNLALYQKLYEEAARFYKLEFGNLKSIPTRIINSKPYLQSTPENVLKNALLLNISKENIELYWLARIMDCLPLPPNWTKKKGTSFDSYIFQPQNLVFDIHPSYIFIMYQMNIFRSYFSQLNPINQNFYLNMRQLNFYDYFERNYTVDMYGYIEKAQIKKSIKQIKQKDNKQVQKYHQTSDWMVLEGVKNTQIQQNNLVLVEYIQKFWSQLNFTEQPWSPAISPYGEVVWSSNVNNKSLNFCPYKSKLSLKIENETKKLLTITDSILKPQYQQKKEHDEDQIKLNINRIKQERDQFINYFIIHQNKAVPYPYAIKQQFGLLNQNNYFNQIFTSPFKLDTDITDIVAQGDKIPFWLQKCKAANYTSQIINLLQFKPLQFINIKQKVTRYAQQMIGEHQPHLLEEHQKKINRISNPEQLVKYLIFVNDLDLRQQRKKEYLIALNQKEEDSDIFGSQISQVQVIDEPDQQFDQEYVQLNVEEQASQKQPSIHPVTEEDSIQQQPQVIQPEQQEIKQIKEQPRQQYQFLKDFKKRIIGKKYDLQLKNQQELNNLLLEVLKMKRRKSKYKKGQIKFQIDIMQKETIHLAQNKYQFMQQKQFDNHNEIKNIKRNLILSHLKKNNFPYQIDYRQILKPIKSSQKELSQMNYSEITNYNDFKSQIDEYQHQEIDAIIKQAKINKQIEARKMRPPTERSHHDHQNTQDTIQLQPIYQIKPDISTDPVLKKITSVDLSDFRKTFQTTINKPIIPKETIGEVIKSKSLKNFRNKQSNYISTPVPAKGISIKIRDKIDLQTKMSLTKREGFGSIPNFQSTHKPFHRVCLQKTCEHFLQKQAFLRKGDIVTIQARKLLLSKGRGLQTYISKFY